jgi:hypothetical protein
MPTERAGCGLFVARRGLSRYSLGYLKKRKNGSREHPARMKSYAGWGKGLSGKSGKASLTSIPAPIPAPPGGGSPLPASPLGRLTQRTLLPRKRGSGRHTPHAPPGRACMMPDLTFCPRSRGHDPASLPGRRGKPKSPAGRGAKSSGEWIRTTDLRVMLTLILGGAVGTGYKSARSSLPPSDKERPLCNGMISPSLRHLLTFALSIQ